MGSASPPLPPPSRTSASSTGSKCSQLSVVVLLPDSIVNDSVPHPLHRPKGPGSAPMVGPPLRLWHGLCLHAPHKHHYSLKFDGQTPGLNVITEYAMGLIMPGYPIANVCFKVYGYMSMSQAVAFLSDFKLGHYMKIPPRSMFIVQVIKPLNLLTL
uniref:Uncharacterized protein n=1 Tax=Aegilops tauschii subsp. strangulata TaxID=200361 RepID=A0A453PBD7_AEGTS